MLKEKVDAFILTQDQIEAIEDLGRLLFLDPLQFFCAVTMIVLNNNLKKEDLIIALNSLTISGRVDKYHE